MNQHVDELTADTKGFQAAITQARERWARMQPDDETSPPTAAAIDAASCLAGLPDRPPPDRIVPNGDGGIVFEWWEGKAFETLEVSDRGDVEFCLFIDCKLVERKPQKLPAERRCP